MQASHTGLTGSGHKNMGYLSLSGLNGSTQSELSFLRTAAADHMARFSKSASVGNVSNVWESYLKVHSNVVSEIKKNGDYAANEKELIDILSRVRNVKDSTLKRLGATSAAAPASTSSSSYEFGDLLNKISPDPAAPVSTRTHVSTYATPVGYTPKPPAKQEESGGVISAIADVVKAFGQAASAAAPAVAAGYQHKLTMEQEKTRQKAIAAGLIPASQVSSTGLSTTTKVVLGLGGTALLAFILYKATRP